MPATALPHPRELVLLGPHAGALRAGVSIAVPLLALWAIGRTDLSL